MSTLTEAAEKLRAATEWYVSTELEYGAANSRRCNAANNLNEAQREFDALVAALHDAAPQGSDWKRRETYRPPQPK